MPGPLPRSARALRSRRGVDGATRGGARTATTDRAGGAAPRRPPPAHLHVVGLGGGERVEALAAAGHEVAAAQTVEYADLVGVDLLVVGLRPPEPPPWAVVRVLRERCVLPILVLADPLTSVQRRWLLRYEDVDYLPASCDDRRLVRAVDAALGRRTPLPSRSWHRAAATRCGREEEARWRPAPVVPEGPRSWSAGPGRHRILATPSGGDRRRYVRGRPFGPRRGGPR
jgi:hypothetical protein